VTKIMPIELAMPRGTVFGGCVGGPPLSEAEHYSNVRCAGIFRRRDADGVANTRSRCRIQFAIGRGSCQRSLIESATEQTGPIFCDPRHTTGPQIYPSFNESR
jgi:hypothetical protein